MCLGTTMEEYVYNSQGSYCTIVCMCLGTTMEEYVYNSHGSYCTIVCMCLGTTIWLLFMHKGMLLQMKPYKGLSVVERFKAVSCIPTIIVACHVDSHTRCSKDISSLQPKGCGPLESCGPLSHVRYLALFPGLVQLLREPGKEATS